MADTDLKSQSGVYEEQADAVKRPADVVKAWLEAIALASTEEKNWRENVVEANKIFRNDKQEQLAGTAYNIYHANIETLVPALYNSTPTPDIRRRFNDKDPIAKQGAEVLERCLSSSLDTYDFDAMMLDTAKDMSLAGRGISRITYDAKTGPVGPGPDGQQPLDEQGNPVEDITYQSCGGDHVPWASFRRGPGRRWADVNWLAFANYYTREALRELSPKYGDKVPLDAVVSADAGKENEAKQDKPAPDIFKRALVWEVWDKEARQVRFIAPGFKDDCLAEVDDPLELENFFPIPPPMMGVTTPGELTPICEYQIYKGLIDEMDQITRRITKLIKQLRPRMAVPGGELVADLTRFAEADDSEIIELANAAAFMDAGGIEKMIAWWPLDPIVKAMAGLYEQRERVKQSIYEVTGIADIMRGATDPNETLGAQQLKAQWGSLRVQKRQQEVQRYARDFFRMKAELIANKFTPQQLSMMAGFPVPPEVVDFLRQDVLRNYRIDIETDSTIKGDITRNMESMSNFVQGTAQYWQAMIPLVQADPTVKQAAVTIYSAFARNFKLGKEVDDILDKLGEEAQAAAQQAQANPQPPPPDPRMEEVKQKAPLVEAQTEKVKAEGQIVNQKGLAETQLHQNALELHSHAVAEARHKASKAETEAALARQQYEHNQDNHEVGILTAGHDQLLKEDNQQLKADTAEKTHQLKADTAAAKTTTNGKGKPQAAPTAGGLVMKLLAELVKGQEQMMLALTAPKHIVRDQSGRVAGVEVGAPRTVN